MMNAPFSPDVAGSPAPLSLRRSSRRRFLTASAAVLAAPSIVPASVFGQNAPSNRITLGVIGMGDRGPQHLHTLKTMNSVQVTAVCDVKKPYIEHWRRDLDAHYARATRSGRYQGCGAYQDYRELLARPDIDAVFICAPENWHAKMTIDAVRAGKDVYCEKAMSLTVAEGQAMCDAVRRYGRVFQTGTQQRSSDRFRKACELALNGYVGDVREVRVGVPGGRALPNAKPAQAPADIDYDLWLGPARWTPYNDLKCRFNWYFMSDYCAGWIQSWGVHHLDIAHWGCPDLGRGRMTVEGEAVFPNDGLADTSITWKTKLTTSTGVVLSFASNDTPDHSQGARFIGDKGWVRVNRGGIWAEPTKLLEAPPAVNDHRLYESSHHHDNFVECVKTRRDPVSPVEAGHTATTLSLIADIATRLSRKLTWDWDSQRFINDEAADRMLSRAYRSPWRL